MVSALLQGVPTEALTYLSHPRSRVKYLVRMPPASAWYVDDRGFDPTVRQHSFLETGHEIIYTAIISLLLIQEDSC